MKLYIADPPDQLQENTKKNQTCLLHFTRFHPAIYFNNIDKSFIQEHQNSLPLRADSRIL